MSRQISDSRKTAYYAGMALTIVGVVVFLSTFVAAGSGFGQGEAMMLRALGGMALMVVGRIVSSIGARGLAGSGVVLDPEKARRDLEPYSRMAGGMVKDVLDEADVQIGGRAEQVVMVKCRACGKLNEEDSRFCQECGQAI